jgi:hypothetical protein
MSMGGYHHQKSRPAGRLANAAEFSHTCKMFAYLHALSVFILPKKNTIQTIFSPTRDMRPVSIHASSVEAQAAKIMRRMRASVPERVSPKHVIGSMVTLRKCRVFAPAHKVDYDLSKLKDMDILTALRGSDGECEMVAVLRPRSVVLVLDIIEKSSEERTWVVQDASTCTSLDYMDQCLHEEVLAREKGRLLELAQPVRHLYAKVRVCHPAPHSADLMVRDSCGFLIIHGDRSCSYGVAGPPDFTEGFLETPGVEGFIFLQSVCETMTWSLSSRPMPRHKDHDRSREHERIMSLFKSMLARWSGKPAKTPGRAGAKSFRRRERRRLRRLRRQQQ